MAIQTDTRLRNQVIYSIYVRNHTQEGTFDAIIPDLPRIKGLGVDIIWLMPIHPIGEVMRKGVAGSPYAIQDYRSINPEYGTMETFEQFVSEVHKHDMKVMIDVVYNHTSPDSVLVHEHPEWFYRRSNGNMGNKVGEWYDIVDLDYSHRGLWDYLIDTLKMWAEKVDGFRCDVASLVPIAFWEEAREAVSTVNPDTIWLAESVHTSFLRQHRDRKNVGLSDSEVYRAFDMTYDYDVHNFFEQYMWKEITLKHYLDILMFQDGIYPENYVKLRFLENHDQPRIRSYIKDTDALANWTAFSYFQKGTALLFAGQEKGFDHLPDLFNKDVVKWNEANVDLTQLIQKLYRFKQDDAVREGAYALQAPEGVDVVIGSYIHNEKTIVGIFNLDGGTHVIQVDVPDGSYKNLLHDEEYVVRDGVLLTSGKPIIFAYFHEAQLSQV